MAQILEYGLKMSMLFSGSYQPQFTQAAESMSKLQQKIQTLQSTSAKVTGFQKQQTALNATREKLESARERVRKLREEYRKSDSPSDAMRKQLARAQKEAGQLGEKFTEQRRKLAELNGELRRSGVDTSKLADYQSKLSASTDKAKAAQDKLANAQSRYQKLMANLSWGNMKDKVLGAMASAKILEAPVRLSMDFEAAMARVKAVGFTDGTNLEGFERLKAQALQLGADTKFTAVQAAQAQEALIRGNFTPQQTIDAMPGLLNMAAAEGLGIEEAARIVAKGLGGMGLDAKLAGRLADVLAYTSSKSNTDIRTMSEALIVAGPPLSKQGVQLEQLASYIGALANKGFEGSEVGNALAASISRLARRPKQADDALKALGVTVKTESGRLVEIPHIMEQLAEKMRTMGELDQQKYLSQIFGGNYDKIMLALMDAVNTGMQGRLQAGEYIESFGWAEKMSSINLDTLAGQLDILKSSWDGIRTTIGDIFSPYVRKLIEGVSNVLSKANKFIKDNYSVMKPIIALTGAGLFAKTAGGIASIGWSILQLPFAKLALWNAEKAALSAVPGGMSALANSAGAVGSAMTGAAKGASLFGMSLSTALGWIGLIAFASYEIYTHWKEITEWATKAGQAISSIDTGKISAAKAGTLPRNDQDYGVAVMNSTFMPPEIKQHASGGIMTSPHIGLVAEAGPEAIIPLSNKAQGVPILNQAADILGVRSDDNDIARFVVRHDYSVNNTGGTSQYIAPVVNLTVNAGAQTDTGLTERIKSAVIEAMDEIFSREERLSYAV